MNIIAKYSILDALLSNSLTLACDWCMYNIHGKVHAKVHAFYIAKMDSI